MLLAVVMEMVTRRRRMTTMIARLGVTVRSRTEK
jgi:hypothetical protein